MVSIYHGIHLKYIYGFLNLCISNFLNKLKKKFKAKYKEIVLLISAVPKLAKTQYFIRFLNVWII